MPRGSLRLAENIALLQRLGPELERPHPSDEDQAHQSVFLPETDGSRQLKLHHERGIADSLAFLSAYTDEPSRAIALCIEERPSPGGLVIRTAVNSGSQDTLHAGLGAIVSILEQEAKAPLAGGTGSALIKAVVQHNQLRHLTRIGSTHAPTRFKKGGQPVSAHLLDALTSCSDGGRNPPKRLRDLAEEMDGQFRKLEGLSTAQARSHAGVPLLESMLHVAREICSSYPLKDVFAHIPFQDPEWNEARKRHVMLAFSKLAMYVERCQYLVAAARRFSLFQSVTLEKACEMVVPRVREPAKGEKTAAGVLDCCVRKNSRIPKATRKKIAERATTRLGGASLKEIQQQIREQVVDPQRRYKIHAEMQLLFHYEQHPVTPRPRVLCSGRGACFLCDLFLRYHGGFRTPRAHGTVYDRWILPDLNYLSLTQPERKRLRALVAGFEDLVEQTLIECVVGDRLGRAQTHQPCDGVCSVRGFTPSSSDQGARHLRMRGGVVPPLSKDGPNNMSVLHLADSGVGVSSLHDIPEEKRTERVPQLKELIEGDEEEEEEWEKDTAEGSVSDGSSDHADTTKRTGHRERVDSLYSLSRSTTTSSSRPTLPLPVGFPATASADGQPLSPLFLAREKQQQRPHRIPSPPPPIPIIRLTRNLPAQHCLLPFALRSPSSTSASTSASASATPLPHPPTDRKPAPHQTIRLHCPRIHAEFSLDRLADSLSDLMAAATTTTTTTTTPTTAMATADGGRGDDGETTPADPLPPPQPQRMATMHLRAQWLDGTRRDALEGYVVDLDAGGWRELASPQSLPERLLVSGKGLRLRRGDDVLAVWVEVFE